MLKVRRYVLVGYVHNMYSTVAVCCAAVCCAAVCACPFFLSSHELSPFFYKIILLVFTRYGNDALSLNMSPPTNDDASTGFAQSQLDAALAAASFGSSTAGAAAAEDIPKRKRKTYSYKDHGIRAGKSFFILPDKQDSAFMCPEFMEGVITSRPKKPDVNYTIHWTSTENLPIHFDQSYLRRTLCKDDKSGMVMLKAARDAWDAEHPNQKNPRVPQRNTERRSKSRATTERLSPSTTNSARRTMEILTSLHMPPSLDPTEEEDHHEPQTNSTTLYAKNSDSDSDDGSDIKDVVLVQIFRRKSREARYSRSVHPIF